MLKDITLGQYYPSNSFVHCLDPRTKILVTVLMITVLFVANSLWAYVLVCSFITVSVLISRVPVRMVLRAIKPILFIVAFTMILNIFYTSGTPLLTLNLLGLKLRITYEGLKLAAYMSVRIVFLVIGTSLLTYTTSPIELTDGLERLLYPLTFIKVPVHDFAMMMTLALRFIPTLIEETDKIMNAQKARGADMESGKIAKRIKALVPILIPLFASAIKRAVELASAMECRCYNGGKGRTRMKTYRMVINDYMALAVIVTVFVLTVFLNKVSL